MLVSAYQYQMILLCKGGNPDVIFRDRRTLRPEVVFDASIMLGGIGVAGKPCGVRLCFIALSQSPTLNNLFPTTPSPQKTLSDSLFRQLRSHLRAVIYLSIALNLPKTRPPNLL